MKLEQEFANVSLTQFLEQIDSQEFYWIIKRLSGNDTGLTGGHQVGMYLPRKFFREVFPEICTTHKHNPYSLIKECYFPNHDYRAENVRAIYYNSKYFPELGLKKKYDEFRLTAWGGKQSPIQQHESTGSTCLLAARKTSSGSIESVCWVASSLEEEILIEGWLGDEVEPGRFYNKKTYDTIPSYEEFEYELPENWFLKFPPGKEIFSKVMELVPRESWMKSIDELLLHRREIEFKIFKEIENREVLPHIEKGFSSVDDFIKYSHSISNRRKSRTGTSLELNLENIFRDEKLVFDTQATTENKKKPDFLFPSQAAYHDKQFPESKIHMLAAKTCCKDRWRQMITEAERISTKHLFTLQEGVSENQLNEMYDSNVILVVPKTKIKSFPKSYRDKILNLEGFVKFIIESQADTNGPNFT